jgi:hypothetical protein
MRGRVAAIGLLLAVVGLAACGQGEPQVQETLQSTVTAAPSSTTSPEDRSLPVTITQPQANALAFSPLRVAGTTSAFEVLALVCDAAGTELGRAFVGGAGDTGESVPFDSAISFSSPGTSTGTLVYVGKNTEGGPGGVSCSSAFGRIPLRFASFTG